MGAVAFNILGKHHGGRMRTDLERALDWWVEVVSEGAKPGTITVGDERPPILIFMDGLIFTDGAHEDDGTRYGGVMIDPSSGEVAGFGRNMKKKMKERLSAAVVRRNRS